MTKDKTLCPELLLATTIGVVGEVMLDWLCGLVSGCVVDDASTSLSPRHIDQHPAHLDEAAREGSSDFRVRKVIKTENNKNISKIERVKRRVVVNKTEKTHVLRKMHLGIGQMPTVREYSFETRQGFMPTLSVIVEESDSSIDLEPWADHRENTVNNNTNRHTKQKRRESIIPSRKGKNDRLESIAPTSNTSATKRGSKNKKRRESMGPRSALKITMSALKKAAEIGEVWEVPTSLSPLSPLLPMSSLETGTIARTGTMVAHAAAEEGVVAGRRSPRSPRRTNTSRNRRISMLAEEVGC